MRYYIGFDDTDIADCDRGTGKLARMYAETLPAGCRVWGVLRQQLPKFDGIPYTSNNSSACVVVDAEDAAVQPLLITSAVAHLESHFIEGSDPGLCVAAEDTPSCAVLIAFGRTCAVRLVSQSEAMDAAEGVYLSGHGGTNDGIIGAAAAVGLTMYGWSGRFIDYGRIRELPETVTVATIEAAGILVLPTGRDDMPPGIDDVVETGDWLRPRLWSMQPVLPVQRRSDGVWEVVDGEIHMKKKNAEDAGMTQRTQEI